MSGNSRFVRYASKTARYLVLSLAENLPQARRLVLSSPLSATDGGAGGDYTVGVEDASSSAKGIVKLPGTQLGGTADAPDVRGIRVTDGGGVLLEFGDVADGEALVRSGSNVVGFSAVAGSRTVSAGAGLSGGGDLSADRSLAVAAFTGLVSKDFDPGSDSWSASETKVHATYDVGAEGQLMPVALRLPATLDANLQTEAVFEFSDATTVTAFNTSTGSDLDFNLESLSNVLMGPLSSAASNNGKRVRKIILQTRNTSGSGVGPFDIGAFRVRAFAMARGGGSAI